MVPLSAHLSIISLIEIKNFPHTNYDALKIHTFHYTLAV